MRAHWLPFALAVGLFSVVAIADSSGWTEGRSSQFVTSGGSVSLPTGKNLDVTDGLSVSGSTNLNGVQVSGLLDALGNFIANSDATFYGRTRFEAQVVSIPDDLAGTPAAFTFQRSPGDAGNVVTLDCLDANGCTITMGETAPYNGEVIWVVNISANACNFADTAGVSETVGALALGQWDTVQFVYITDRWVQLSAVVNN